MIEQEEEEDLKLDAKLKADQVSEKDLDSSKEIDPEISQHVEVLKVEIMIKDEDQ